MDSTDDPESASLPDAVRAIASYLPKDASPENLEEALRKAVISQQQASDKIRQWEVEEVSSLLKKRRNSSVAFTGLPGAGKTAIFEGIAAKMQQEKEQEQERRVVMILDEIHGMGEAAFFDAMDAAQGRPTRRQLGEMAAEVCRKGTTTPVACMKPLRYKRGFYSLTF